MGIPQGWDAALNATFDKFGIATPAQQASFIGQCSHECNNFRTLEENLNYKAEALMRLWSKRFPTLEIANQYAKNPQKIANKVYADRMGNRDEASGDGYRFRGRGCIQLTGHANYFHAGAACGIDFVMQPDLVATPQYAAMTAGWFWSTHGLNQFADSQDYVAMTKRINGGTIGLDERIAKIQSVLRILG
jgi:putative chitinase